jgi:SAM-dependent methyltransferase
VNDYTATTYGETISEVYDRLVPDIDPAMVPLLSELAAGGRALELGIGTGRVSLPLRAAGVRIEGIEISPAMVAQLRKKPGGADIPVTIGNFVDLPVEGEFALIFIPYNTVFQLLTQDEQVRCFESVAEHLAPRGVFLVDAFVPDLTRYRRRSHIEIETVDLDLVQMDVSRLDPVQQRVDTQQVMIADGRVKLFPVSIRFAWPSELDLMARIAGLRLRDRWGGWRREPFTAESTKHISVYEKARPPTRPVP